MSCYQAKNVMKGHFVLIIDKESAMSEKKLLDHVREQIRVSTTVCRAKKYSRKEGRVFRAGRGTGGYQTLKRKCMISPSSTIYSMPPSRVSPSTAYARATPHVRPSCCFERVRKGARHLYIYRSRLRDIRPRTAR